jgi:hypothetical protein
MIRFLLTFLLMAMHPVHVSLMSIDYVPEQKLLNVFLKLYFDDFLIDAEIKPEDHKNLDFSEYNRFSWKVLDDYINSKIRITVNNKQLPAEMKDMVLSDNELRVKLFLNSPEIINIITVKNNIMTSLYDDQANMIIVKVNDFEEGFRLTAKEPEKIFKIN